MIVNVNHSAVISCEIAEVELEGEVLRARETKKIEKGRKI